MKTMLVETTGSRQTDVKYTRLDDFRKKLILALLNAGKGEVIWTKCSPQQPDKLRQIVRLENKKYMVHFWKNKLTDIYLLEKNNGLSKIPTR